MLNLLPDLFPYGHINFKPGRYKTTLRQVPEAVQHTTFPMEPKGGEEVVDADAEEVLEFKLFHFGAEENMADLDLGTEQDGDILIDSDHNDYADHDADVDEGVDAEENERRLGRHNISKTVYSKHRLLHVDRLFASIARFNHRIEGWVIRNTVCGYRIRTVHPRRQGQSTTVGDLSMDVRTSPAYKTNLLALKEVFDTLRQATLDVPLFCVTYNREWRRVFLYIPSKWAPKMNCKVKDYAWVIEGSRSIDYLHKYMSKVSSLSEGVIQEVLVDLQQQPPQKQTRDCATSMGSRYSTTTVCLCMPEICMDLLGLSLSHLGRSVVYLPTHDKDQRRNVLRTVADLAVEEDESDNIFLDGLWVKYLNRPVGTAFNDLTYEELYEQYQQYLGPKATDLPPYDGENYAKSILFKDKTDRRK
ncbi:hypothetical protein EMPS_04032 [Entomortierella parvispora]|uniref:Uncharacterized protein n=1 Tax=Entomortierella parvispora TaxID=205924 RepID=A0A9P3H7X6_9FUNG|nr:hypothetical protein EMPS_04032 [Entomortierella parvispora]